MKNSFVAAALFVGLASAPCFAQELSLGGGFGYGSNIKNLGLNIRGDVRFYDIWSVAPNFNLFFNKQNEAFTREWKDLNIDGHLYFKMDRRWKLYPLIGINFATVSEREDNLTFSNSEVGLNLGAGSEIKLDRRLSGFGELKYVLSDAEQAVATFGLIYRITE